MWGHIPPSSIVNNVKDDSKLVGNSWQRGGVLEKAERMKANQWPHAGSVTAVETRRSLVHTALRAMARALASLSALDI